VQVSGNSYYDLHLPDVLSYVLEVGDYETKLVSNRL